MDALIGATGDDNRESDGRVRGVALAIVTDNRDPDNLGRVRVRLPWHSRSQTSYWARIAAPMAGSGRGAYFLPEIDDEVLVAFDGEDPSHPYIIGGLWNGGQTPPETNRDGRNDRRVIRSRSGHTLVFDDSSTAPKVEITLAQGRSGPQRVVLDDQGVRISDDQGNSIAISGSGGGITVESGTQLRLSAPRISIQANGALEIQASATLTLRGSQVLIN
jgi:uncharacterized protein involved in type VI secretion and phage assembly